MNTIQLLKLSKKRARGKNVDNGPSQKRKKVAKASTALAKLYL